MAVHCQEQEGEVVQSRAAVLRHANALAKPAFLPEAAAGLVVGPAGINSNGIGRKAGVGAALCLGGRGNLGED